LKQDIIKKNPKLLNNIIKEKSSDLELWLLNAVDRLKALDTLTIILELNLFGLGYAIKINKPIMSKNNFINTDTCVIWNKLL